MLKLLRNTAFRRLFFGRLITNAGDSLYAVAAMWLVYELTGSSTYTGLAGALTMAPQLAQMLIGPLVDHWPLRRLLIAIQLVQATVVLVIPAAWLFGIRSVTLVLVVVPVLSLLNQFVYPAQSAALPRIVAQEELTEANAAFSFAYQGADLVFNGLAGALVAAVGAVALYTMDALTFVIAAVLFAGVNIPTARTGDMSDETTTVGETKEATEVTTATDGGDTSSYLARLRAGIEFVRGTPLVWLLGVGVFANGLLGASNAVLPAFADQLGGSSAYGTIRAGTAAGLLVGALLGSRIDDIRFGPLVVSGFLCSAGGWFAALFVPSLPATAFCFAVALIPVGTTNVLIGTMIQRMVPDAFLGRVSALLGSASVAVTPVGMLLGGTIGEKLGVAVMMAAGGFGLLSVAGYVAAVPALRRLPAVNEMRTIRSGLNEADRR